MHSLATITSLVVDVPVLEPEAEATLPLAQPLISSLQLLLENRTFQASLLCTGVVQCWFRFLQAVRVAGMEAHCIGETGGQTGRQTDRQAPTDGRAQILIEAGRTDGRGQD